jgi:uncharacterized protein YgbK (DUF1537 family)
VSSLGCIADDFTGTTDLANTSMKGGMSAVQVIGVPRAPFPEADGIIVALKSPTSPLAESLPACEALLAAGSSRELSRHGAAARAGGRLGPTDC